MGKKVFVDLTHPFSAEIPRWPYFDKPVIDNTHTMAKGGVLTQKVTCTMHTGTHCRRAPPRYGAGIRRPAGTLHT